MLLCALAEAKQMSDLMCSKFFCVVLSLDIVFDGFNPVVDFSYKYQFRLESLGHQLLKTDYFSNFRLLYLISDSNMGNYSIFIVYEKNIIMYVQFVHVFKLRKKVLDL